MHEPSEHFQQDCITRFNDLRRNEEWEIRDDVSVPALRYAAIIILVKNSEDIIHVNLEHHYRLGFRRFFILDNNSTDKTSFLILSFKKNHEDADVFYTTDYNPAHRQAIKTGAMATFAENYLHNDPHPIDWFFPIDADEFITCCTKNTVNAVQEFTNFLEDSSSEVLVFNWAQSALFSKETRKFTTFSDRLSTTEFSTWNDMKVHVTKIAYRANHQLTPTEGNHFVDNYHAGENGLRSMTAIGFCLLHFPMRSIEQLRCKLVDGVNGLNAAKHHPSTGGHWRYYHNHYLRHGDKALHAFLMEHINSCL